MLQGEIQRLNTVDVIFMSLALFIFVSIFIADTFYRPILAVMGLLGLLFGYKLLGVRPVPPDQLASFRRGLKAGAHRGLAEDAPENTLEAFQVSKALRADSIEFDVEYTKDDVAVLMHDDTVDRTTDGSGHIRDLTWHQVQQLNAAAKFNDGKHPVAKVPLLADGVEHCLKQGFKIFFDIKRFHPKLVETITSLFQKHQELYERGAVCSFDPRISYYIKRADPRIITGHTWRPFFMSYEDYERTKPNFDGFIQHFAVRVLEAAYLWSLHKFLWKFTGADLILANHFTISVDYIRMWRERGVHVVAWTVNDYHERLFYLNSLKCPFLTDKLSDMQDELKKAHAADD